MSDLHRVRVTCKRATGLWRGGKHWPNGHTEADLDKAAVEVLLKEPLLSVAIQDGKGWRVISREIETSRPARGEPALESETQDLLDTIDELRRQLREQRDLHSKETAKLRAEIDELRRQLDEATAPPPPPPAAEPPAAEPSATAAKKK